jgi:heme/copper-type cytochrome/quinol oxidase subunit 1
MDQQIDELKAMVAAYQAAPPQQPMAAIDLSVLINLIPAILSLFGVPPALAAIVMKLVEILQGLFSQAAGSAQP